MMPPICVPCILEMRVVKNDRLICDRAEDGVPSTYWLGDEWACPQCGARIVTGQGKALANHPGVGYGEALEFQYEVPKGEAAT